MLCGEFRRFRARLSRGGCYVSEPRSASRFRVFRSQVRSQVLPVFNRRSKAPYQATAPSPVGSRRVSTPDTPMSHYREVAERLSLSTQTVLRWVRRGVIPAARLPGGAIRFDQRTLGAWLAERATGGNHGPSDPDPGPTRPREPR